MATPFDRLMTTIRPHLPGAIDDAIRQELFQVCTKFFDETNVWTEEVEITVPAGERNGEALPTAGRISQLLSAQIDGRPVTGAVMHDISCGVVRFPISSGPATYTVVYALTVSDPLTRDAYPIVPFDIIQRYTQQLIHGILANMMAQPQKPYTNLQLAQFHERRFQGGIGRARTASKAGHTYDSQSWAFPQTFNRR